MNSELRVAIDQVSNRWHERKLWIALGTCWFFWAIVAICLKWWLDQQDLLPSSVYSVVATLGLLTICSALACYSWISIKRRNYRAIATAIETRHPDLNTALLAAVDTETSTSPERYSFLSTALLSSVLRHRRTHNWNETISSRSILAAKVLHATTFVGLLLVASLLIAEVRSKPLQRPTIVESQLPFGITVSPGDAEVERGTSLLVVAEFGDVVPADANIIVSTTADDKEEKRSIRMARSLQDPKFAARIEQIDEDLTYRIAYDNQESDPYQVKVFEYPQVLRLDAYLTFPSYTALAPRLLEDIRHVTAVEGTDLTLTFHINKKIDGGEMVDDEGEVIELARNDSIENIYIARLKLEETRHFKVELTDAEGRNSKLPFEFTVNATENRPPIVKNVEPSRDTRVSPIEELSLSGVFEDDFGIVRHGISYTLAGKEPVEIELASADISQKLKAEHLLDFEKLNVEADELLTYFLWAEDFGPDGQPRRSASDMFFAEVRPFEEIFRQGEQPQGEESQVQQQQQGGGNGQEATQLAELQKQIINATWNLIRREQRPTLTENYKKDVTLLSDSQKSAIPMAEQLSEQLRDATSRSRLQEALEHMEKAAELLDSGVNADTIEQVTSALSVEQAAYQALLKLRDREFEVSRRNAQQQGGSSGSAGSPSQRQLQQLELKNDENRYEQQRSAQSDALAQQQSQQQELRQVLNRLRELAQRQSDLNERIKELQSALEAASEQEVRDELDRRLKRLREQQQQLLRDTDELQERMEREGNRDRMEESLDQVAEARENVRRASEALEQGQLSQALTEGTRAGQQLNQLEEAVRKQTANEFEQTLTDLKNEARQLDETQNELSLQLTESIDSKVQTLRAGPDREQLKNQFEMQRERLDRLTERMRQLVQDAEETEPQLAEEIFNATEDIQKQSVPEALQAAERLTELGIPEEAARASKSAEVGLKQLHENIERAAESIIGDKTTALQLAEAELNDLKEQLDREFRPQVGTDREEARRNDPTDEVDTQTQDSEEMRSRPSSERLSDSSNEQASDSSPDVEQRGGASSNRPGSPQEESEDQSNREPSDSGAGSSGQEQASNTSRPTEEGEARRSGAPQGQQPSPGESNNDSLTRSSRPGSSGESADSSRQRNGGADSQREPRGLRARGTGGGEAAPDTSRQRNLDMLIDSFGSDGGTAPRLPITGEGFVEWSDRMRNVEELLDDPELSAEAARIRDRVRGAREDFKRHSKEPDWSQLQTLIAEPLGELRDRVADEVRRRRSPDSLVPIDRDPVPRQFAEDVRRYYERLGSGQ